MNDTRLPSWIHVPQSTVSIVKERAVPKPVVAVSKASIAHENELLSLIRRRAWKQAHLCCQARPSYCYPVPKDALYYETALGLLCRGFDQSEDCFALAQYLIRVCPQQVACSQLQPGYTPIRDALTNSHCTLKLLQLLLSADETHTVLLIDRDGLFPLDHVLRRVARDPHALPLLRDLLRRGVWTGAPLLRLLGASVSSVLCVELLLQEHPSVLYQRVSGTGCTVLHVALRQYVPEIFQRLVQADAQGSLWSVRNRFGDLPLHVACAVGVPPHVLRTVLEGTLRQERGATLVWSLNGSNGYTPVDLEWTRHIEQGSSFFARRLFNQESTTTTTTDSAQSLQRRYDDFYNRLLRETVQHERATASTRALESRPREFVLHRMAQIMDAANGNLSSSMDDDDALPDYILHKACRLCQPFQPSLPTPILELLHWLDPDQLSRPDDLGRLPLHCTLECAHPEVSSERAIQAWWEWVDYLLAQPSAGEWAATRDGQGRLPLQCLLGSHLGTLSSNSSMLDDTVHKIVVALVRLHPAAVDDDDPMPPALVAAPSSSLDTVYLLLRLSPGSWSWH